MDKRRWIVLLAATDFFVASFCSNFFIAQIDGSLGSIFADTFGLVGSVLLILARFLPLYEESPEEKEKEREERAEDEAEEKKSSAEEEEKIEDNILGR